MRLPITLVVLYSVSAGAVDWLPATCKAHQTVGMHQYPGDVEEIYKPAVFSRQTFELRENVFLMRHLPEAKGDDDRDGIGEIAGSTRLYVTMRSGDGNEMEFECRPVRGTGENRGYSCVNNPPSEMLLINPARARFTRSAIGGWTFYTPESSLFVEYGTCVEQPAPESASDRRR